jgi:hypothetical protein
MTQQPAEIQVKDINHLGIVAGMIDQMRWVDAVNEIVGVHSLEQVSTGQVLKAMRYATTPQAYRQGTLFNISQTPTTISASVCL